MVRHCFNIWFSNCVALTRSWAPQTRYTLSVIIGENNKRFGLWLGNFRKCKLPTSPNLITPKMASYLILPLQLRLFLLLSEPADNRKDCLESGTLIIFIIVTK